MTNHEAVAALENEAAELDIPVLITHDAINIIADELGIDPDDVIRQYDRAIDPEQMNENAFQCIIGSLIDYALETDYQLQEIRRGLEIEREISKLAEQRD